jgi:hypothetical protein
MQYYYLNQASQQVGPVDIEGLKQAAITPQTLVWKEGMKEWLPANTVAELQHLFAPTPAPPPVPPAVNHNRKKVMVIAAAGLLVIIAVAAVFLLRGKEPKHEEVAVGKIDSAVAKPRADTVARKDTTVVDTTHIVNVDSLASTIWDTTNNANATATTDNNPAPLPGFGVSGGSSSSKENKPKSPAPKKTNKKRSEAQVRETRDESPAPRPTEPERANPARYISVSGTFRKNLVFEAILEGTIRNGYSSQVRDVTIEVTFLDGSGQSVGNKRFTQNGTIPAGASMSFKFKTKPPKGAKTARYEIASVSTK